MKNTVKQNHQIKKSMGTASSASMDFLCFDFKRLLKIEAGAGVF